MSRSQSRSQRSRRCGERITVWNLLNGLYFRHCAGVQPIMSLKCLLKLDLSKIPTISPIADAGTSGFVISSLEASMILLRVLHLLKPDPTFRLKYPLNCSSVTPIFRAASYILRLSRQKNLLFSHSWRAFLTCSSVLFIFCFHNGFFSPKLGIFT